MYNKELPFPEYHKGCEMAELLGVGECESVCPYRCYVIKEANRGHYIRKD